jgi:hypothetical protein
MEARESPRLTATVSDSPSPVMVYTHVSESTLLVAGQTRPRHWAAVVRIVAAGKTDLVSVVDERSSSTGEEHREGHCDALVGGPVVDQRGAAPRAALRPVVPLVPRRSIFSLVDDAAQVVVADPRTHHRVGAIVAVVAVHEALQRREGRSAADGGLEKLLAQREVELPIELRSGVDEGLEVVAVAVVEGLAHHVEALAGILLGVDVGLEALAELGHPGAVNVLDGVRADAVKADAVHPVHDVLRGVGARGGNLVVPMWQVAREPAAVAVGVPAARAALAGAGATPVIKWPEPLRVLFVDLGLRMDVNHRVVEQHLQALRVRRVDQLLQVGLGPEAAFRLAKVRGPVAVVGAVLSRIEARPGAVPVLDDVRDEERVDAEVVEVVDVDFLRHALPVAAGVVRHGRDAVDVAVVRGIAVIEPVDEDRVDDRVAPVGCPSSAASAAASAAISTCTRVATGAGRGHQPVVDVA